MPPQPQRLFKIETIWIREYATTYLPTEAGFSFSDEDLRASGITLVAVKHMLSRGRVVFADKLDAPGAIWVVEGPDSEDNWYRATIRVISENLDVTLMEIEPTKREEPNKKVATE